MDSRLKIVNTEGVGFKTKMPVDGTRELLVKHGWTPPVEPKVVKAVRTTFPYEPLDFGLVEDGESVGGVELLSRFFSRVQQDWEPNNGDVLTVFRAFDEDGDPIPGKRKYILELTMDSE
jgi:hypothetical protein